MKKYHIFYLALLIIFNNAITSLYSQVDISASPTSGKAPLKVQFYYSSSLGGSIEYTKWEFGNGEGESTARTPTHTYLKAGTYTVDFYIKVNTSSGSSMRHVQKKDYISVSEPNTVPTIAVYPDTLTFKEQISFINDTLIYDDGIPDNYYHWASGTRMASRMSPSGPCKIVAIQYYCIASQIYKVGIYKWDNNCPGEALFEGQPLYSYGQGWKTRDISAYNINVTGDFIASFNMIDTTAAIGFDSGNNGRAWDYNGATWDIYNQTYFIRSVVGYENGVIDTLETLTVYNHGVEELLINDIYSDQSWIIDTNPTSFTLQYGESKRVDVSVSCDGLNDQTYLGLINLFSNDPINSTYSLPVKFIIPTGNNTGIVHNVEMPENVDLQQNYPNPFNSSTKIRFHLPKKSNVTLKIFNILGEEIETLLNVKKSAGDNEIIWRISDLPSGIYFYRLETDYSIKTMKLILQK